MLCSGTVRIPLNLSYEDLFLDGLLETSSKNTEESQLFLSDSYHSCRASLDGSLETTADKDRIEAARYEEIVLQEERHKQKEKAELLKRKNEKTEQLAEKLSSIEFSQERLIYLDALTSGSSGPQEQTEGDGHADNVTLRELLNNPLIDKVKLSSVLKKYPVFKVKISELFRTLNSENPSRDTINSAYIAFHNTFADLARTLECRAVLTNMNILRNPRLLLNKINQQNDSDEVVTSILGLLGMNQYPDLCVEETSTISLFKCLEKPQVLATEVQEQSQPDELTVKNVESSSEPRHPASLSKQEGFEWTDHQQQPKALKNEGHKQTDNESLDKLLENVLSEYYVITEAESELINRVPPPEYTSIKTVPSRSSCTALLKVRVENSNNMAELTLDRCLVDHTQGELMDKVNSRGWIDGDNGAGISNAEEYEFTPKDVDLIQKQLKFVTLEGKPPKLFLMHIMHTMHNDRTHQKRKPLINLNNNGCKSTITTLAAILLNTIDNQLTVKIPFHLDINSDTFFVQYQVKAVICHSGRSAKSGHYFVLKIEANGDVISLNDINVSRLFNCKQHPEQFKNWVRGHNINGVVYLLKKLPPQTAR